MVDYDATASLGKRYRRQDEIGTPFCITYDFASEEDHQVTIRDRDSMKQIRLPLEDVIPYLTEKLVY
jgi:glycyl-tRNA synthetase